MSSISRVLQSGGVTKTQTWITLMLVGYSANVFVHSPVAGRELVRLSYQDLVDRSDVVVIGRLVSTVDDEERPVDAALQGNRDNVVPVVSTIRIEAVMKGRSLDNEISIPHWRYREGAAVDNGPRLLKFMARGEKTGVSIATGKPVYLDRPPSYLLFLKSAPGGSFVPVTGQYDPDDSVRRLATADRDHPVPPKEK
jgi:hypothetical protein